jgi:hypothetical protein
MKKLSGVTPAFYHIRNDNRNDLSARLTVGRFHMEQL